MEAHSLHTRARVRPCVRPCMRAFMGACVCGCARVCVHARCMCACMHACVRVCVCMHVDACMHERAHACPGCAHRHHHTKRPSHIAISPSPSCHPTSEWHLSSGLSAVRGPDSVWRLSVLHVFPAQVCLLTSTVTTPMVTARGRS